MPSTPVRTSDRTRQPSAKVAAASLAAPVQTPPSKPKSSSTPPEAPKKKQRAAAPQTPDEPPQQPPPADAGAASLAAAADQWQLLWKTTHADLEAAKSREAGLQQQLKGVTDKFDALTTERNAIQTEKDEISQREQGHLDTIAELQASLERMSATNREKDEAIKQLNLALVEEQANAEAALAAQVEPVDLAKANGAAKQATTLAAGEQQPEAEPEAPKKRGRAATDGSGNVPIKKDEITAGKLNYAAVPFFRDAKIDNIDDLQKVFWLRKRSSMSDEFYANLSDTKKYGKKTDANFEAKLCETLLTRKDQPWVVKDEKGNDKVDENGYVVPDVKVFLEQMYDKYTSHADGTVRKWRYCRLIYPQFDPALVEAAKAWTTTAHAGKSWDGNVGKCVTAGSYLEHFFKMWAEEPDPAKKVWSQQYKEELHAAHALVVKNAENAAKKAAKAAEASPALRKAITKQKAKTKPSAVASAAAAAAASDAAAGDSD